MLHVLFHAGVEIFAFPALRVERVVPLASLKRLPGAPDAFAGLLLFRGSPVPVVDLVQLVQGRASAEVLGSRILITVLDDGGGLGWIAESVRDTVWIDSSEFQTPPVRTDGAPWLGKVASIKRGFVQCVEPSELITGEIRKLLRMRAAG